jgi:hypothetical protein
MVFGTDGLNKPDKSIPSDEFPAGSDRAFFNRAAVTRHERELPHDDFRRAHDDFRGAHNNWRRSYDHDIRMAFESLVPASMPLPSAFGIKTSGHGEEGDSAG